MRLVVVADAVDDGQREAPDLGHGAADLGVREPEDDPFGLDDLEPVVGGGQREGVQDLVPEVLGQHHLAEVVQERGGPGLGRDRGAGAGADRPRRRSTPRPSAPTARPAWRPYAGRAWIIRPPRREVRVSDSSVLGPSRTTASRTDVMVERPPSAAELARRSRSAVSETSRDTTSVISRMSEFGSATRVASRTTVWGRGSTDSADAASASLSIRGVLTLP